MINIRQGFPVPQTGKYKVYVRSITYNQESYIKDCIKGIAAQQSDFPFIHHVIDDCSTDGEQEALKAYLEKECDMENAEYYDNEVCTITVATNKANPNCTIVVYFLKRNMYGNPKKQSLFETWRNVCQYEALCEGDDYWIDPYKLQKQVDWMESHSDYTFCCTDAIIRSPKGDLDWHRYTEDCDITPQEMIKGRGGYVQTASFLYKTDLLRNYPDYCKNCNVGDLPLLLWAVLNGKMRYIAEKTVVYRYISDGSWTARQVKAPIENRIKGWKTEIQLFKGLDEYSCGLYHEEFRNTIKSFLFERLSQNKDDNIHIIQAFADTLSDLDWKDIFYRDIKFQEEQNIATKELDNFKKCVNDYEIWTKDLQREVQESKNLILQLRRKIDDTNHIYNKKRKKTKCVLIALLLIIIAETLFIIV